MVELGAVVELRAERDLERPHLLGRVDGGDVEGERGEPPLVASSRAATRKSRCQGCCFAPGNGMSKPTSTTSSPARGSCSHTVRTHGWSTRSTNPRIASGCTSTYHRFGPRPIAPFWRRAGLVERGLDVLGELLDPLGREGALQRGDAVGVEVVQDRLGVDPGVDGHDRIESLIVMRCPPAVRRCVLPSCASARHAHHSAKAPSRAARPACATGGTSRPPPAPRPRRCRHPGRARRVRSTYPSWKANTLGSTR